MSDLARRPGVSLLALLAAVGVDASAEEAEWAEIELKYEGYLTRERTAAARLDKLDDFKLPDGLPYREFGALSYEAREKLDSQRPTTLGQAGRIPGVSPSDLHSLVWEIAKRKV